MNIKELFESLSVQVGQDVERKNAEIGGDIQFKKVNKNYPLQPRDKFFVNWDRYSAHISLNDEKNIIEFELWCVENTGFQDENVKQETYLIRVNNETIEYHNISFLNVWQNLENTESLSQEIINRFLKFTAQ